MASYLSVDKRSSATLQSQPATSTQTKNAAGGYVFAVDDFTRLERFLILGNEGGTYYATEKKLTKQNGKCVERCITADGRRTVDTIVNISKNGRAPKNDQALYALAMCAAADSETTRQYALSKLSDVARTGTHLFQFIDFVSSMRGWGRALRRGIGNWYTNQPSESLAYQLIKYRQRDGYTHADALRLAHPKPAAGIQGDVMHYAVKGWPGIGTEVPESNAIKTIWAFERLQLASSAKEAAKIINDYRMPREAVPTQYLTDKGVWEALLNDMPMTAMVRNLATMTRVGLVAPMSMATAKIISELTNGERLTRSRMHPIALLEALYTYNSGRSVRGDSTWTPVNQITDALNDAFYKSFGNVEPSNKRTLLGLDVSGSMTMGTISGMPGISPRVGSAAMALVTANTEPQHAFMGFCSQFVPLNISSRMRLDMVCKSIEGLPFGRTDCAQPMLWAQANNVPVDTFEILTDNDTWFGKIHPFQALRDYRQKTGINAKLAVVGMTATQFSIADPSDAGMADFVGFDTAAPQLITEFSK